jgi:uncharacterized membrane protein
MTRSPQRSRWHRWMAVFDLTLLALTALLVSLLMLGIDGVPRVLATLAFACLVPGGALVTRLPFREPDEILAMTVVLSLAIIAAGSLLMAWLGAWHPLWLTSGLAGAAVVPLVADLLAHVFPTGTDDLR